MSIDTKDSVFWKTGGPEKTGVGDGGGGEGDGGEGQGGGGEGLGGMGLGGGGEGEGGGGDGQLQAVWQTYFFARVQEASFHLPQL